MEEDSLSEYNNKILLEEDQDALLENENQELKEKFLEVEKNTRKDQQIRNSIEEEDRVAFEGLKR